MKTNNLKLKSLKFLSAVFVFVFLYFADAQAAAKVLISWQAQGFVPAGYQGKILPSTGTPVKLGLELIKENKLQDISKADIFWYRDGKLLARGSGLKETAFLTSQAPTYSHLIWARINYKQETFEGVTEIPVVNPKVIVKTIPLTASLLNIGKNLIQAVPYFFNVDNLGELIFRWSVNSKNTKGGDVLELEIADKPVFQNQNLNIRVTAQNPKNELEFGSKEINLMVR